MISIAKTDANGVLQFLDDFAPHCWINLTNPLDIEVEKVSAITGIPQEMLKTALDEEESAHIDRESFYRSIIVDVPVIEVENDSYVYSTVPLAVVTGGNYIVTVCLKETSIIDDLRQSRVRGLSTNNALYFTLLLLYRIAVKYLSYLKQIDKTSHRIQAQLHKSMKNKEIIQLLELENSLVYFSTALKANQAVIDKMARFEELKGREKEIDLLDDLMIENRQAIETTGIYRDILSGTMDAFASIINNNVNIVMKLLTIITIILSIPTLIASFWGMNVPLPLQASPVGFIIIVIVTVIVTIVCALLLIKKTSKLK